MTESDDAEPPVHLGTLARCELVETSEGERLLIETEQGRFLLSADSKSKLDTLSMCVDMLTHYVVRDGGDDD